MPELPQLIPPADLLSQFGGIEQGLRRGKRLRIFGLLVAAAQAAAIAANSKWLDALKSLDWSKINDQLGLLLLLFGIAVALLFAGRTKLWLKESREPFRYTFSVAPFEPMADGAPEPRLALLKDDLLERISTRIPRLSRLDDPNETVPPGGEDQGSDEAEPVSHIHITGSYAKRIRPPQTGALLEVTAWVRIGSPGSPSNLAHPVKFPLRALASAQPRSASGARKHREVRDQEYEEVLERVYFSVASEIYQRIQSDVRRKIRLLPRRYFRAIAYFHEAEDYGSSNTLDAYDEAKRLYGDALRTYDPTWGTPWSPMARARPLRRIAHFAIFKLQRTRRALSHLWPALGRIEVLIARAHLGYANALLYRRILAAQLGMSQNPIFETRPIAERAVTRLNEMSGEVPGRDDSLFEAHVTLAFAFDQLGWASAAEDHLDFARGLDPARSERDPRYLFAAGLLERHLLGALRTLQRTVELDGTFEAAQFELARRQQTLWESRDELETPVAETIASEYAKVLALNPGNIEAWARRAYMSWLLGTPADLVNAREDYESGRQYKEIAREAFVVSIDWGLARVAAETGDFDAAYRHYINAVSALVAQGRSYDQFQYTAQQVEPLNLRILKRFESYRDHVQANFDAAEAAPDHEKTERVRKSVLAFVLNDYGWACQQYFNRSGDETKLAAARASYIEAQERNPDFVLAYFNLHFVDDADDGSFSHDDHAEDWLKKIHDREPSWPEANLLMLRRWMERAQAAQDAAQSHADRAGALRAEAVERSKRAETNLPLTKVELAGAKPDRAEVARVIRETAQAQAPLAGVSRTGKEVKRKLKDAKDAEAAQAASLKQRDDCHAKAKRLAPALLPQTWLWAGDEFNWRLVTRPATAVACRRNLLWERSFDDFHARALFHWGRGRRLASDDLNDLNELDAVFEIISSAFWPSDARLLIEQLDLADELEKDTAEYDTKLHAVVRRWVDVDPCYWTLRWLTKRLSDEKGKRDAVLELQRAAQRNLAAGLYKWLGDQLRDLADCIDGDEKAPALDAYHKAVTAAEKTKEYSLLVEVGGRLDEIEGTAAAEPVYRCALKSTEASDLAEAGDWFARHEHWQTASEAMGRALDHGPDPEKEAIYRRTYARSLWAQKKYGNALQQLTKADTSTVLGGEWRVALARELETGRSAEREQLREWLAPRQREAVAAGSVGEAVDAGRALLESSRAREPAPWETPLEDDSTDGAPLAVPVQLTADGGFFLEGENTPGLDRTVHEQIRQMLRRIHAERGLCPRSVAIWRPDDVPERYYSVSLNDSPVESGHVPDEVDDPCEYMLARVDELIRRGLARFADSETIDALLQQWAVGAQNGGLDAKGLVERRALLESALPDEPARRRFRQVVRELVREGVSVARVHKLLDIDIAVDVPLFECVERARAELREDLPVAGRRMLEMPADIEEELVEWWGQNGRRSLTLSESADREIAERLREFVEEHVSVNGDGADPSSRRAALIVADAALRPFASRFVERHLPGIPVLSRDERPKQQVHDHPRIGASFAKAARAKVARR